MSINERVWRGQLRKHPVILFTFIVSGWNFPKHLREREFDSLYAFLLHVWQPYALLHISTCCCWSCALCVEYPLFFSGCLASWTATPTTARLHAGKGVLACFRVALLTAVNADDITNIWGGSPQIYACLSCPFPLYVSTESDLLFWHWEKKSFVTTFQQNPL